ncbi:MAG: monooxygenase [Micrococcales bacterium 73-13]|nr:MAG: monooxygenase [Micrococcales bacterium 73-13]
MTSIGIIGAGTGGLHLALQLVQAGMDVTVYASRTAEQVASGRMTNSVAHHAVTIDREARLGVDHWPVAEFGYDAHLHYFGLPEPIEFIGRFQRPSRAVDYRIYLPRLMADFEDRGGRLVVREVDASDLEPLSEAHDLLAVGSKQPWVGEVFGRRADKPQPDGPLRRLQVGLWHGIARSEPHGVSIAASPGSGDLLEIPIYSAAGHVTALLFENVPGGALEHLASIRHDDDPAAFRRAVLDALRQHYPRTFERVDDAEFALTGPDDLVQGAVTPALRNDYRQLDNGRFVVAVGDSHATVDPIVGQGANSASASAQVVGDAILEDPNFDLRLMRKIAERRRDRVEATFDWTALMAGPPPAHLLQLVGAMSQDQALLDEFTWNFNFPDRQWDILATPERVASAVARSAARKAVV